MASDRPRFTIRRIPPSGDTQARRLSSQQPLEPRVVEEPVPGLPPVALLADFTGGLFHRASGVLAFLGSALGTGLSDEAAVRQTPDGNWWAEVQVPCYRIAPLVCTAGGRPFASLGNHWMAVSLSGELSADGDVYKTCDVAAWPVVELAYLLAQTSLLPGRYAGTTALDVVVPGALGRLVLRRGTALGLRVAIMPVLRHPLGDEGSKNSGAMLLRLRAERGRPVPAALVHSLTQLPYTIVGEPFGSGGQGVLVDVRHRLPLSPLIVQGMIPRDETWAFGSPDVGYWRLRPAGIEADGTLLLDAPAVLAAEAPLLPPTELPTRIPVRLVCRPGAGSRVDGVLLDDAELGWLRPFLMGRPVGEMSFLLPGPGHHLLTAPGGLPGALPFGIPLVRVGPGALYLELGTDFYPPLPDGARQECFQLSDDAVVAVVNNAAYRFDATRLLPAWTLWVGDAPEVQAGLSRRGERLLARISAAIRQAEAEQVMPHAAAPRAPVSRKERVQLLERAQRAELMGDLVGAAQLLEQAGHPGPAGRLYERAAARP